MAIKTNFYKTIIIFLMISMIFTFSGCGGESRNIEVVLENCNEYIEFTEAVDKIIGSYSLDETESNLFQEFNKASAEKKSEMALDMADDIARANFYGLAGEEIMGIAGSLVKAYPHPLLLNNFATMVLENEDPEEALYFFLLAAAQEPGNPVILTNVANVYMELDNFSEAKRYADLALSASNDYGPAYQVLTTIHLKEDNSELAAETMVKSAKYCFNDISVYHFNSYLGAVSELDRKEDEYPLKEELLNELYAIAKENTGDFTDVSTDHPDSQLTLKPFPPITGPDNLMNSEEYFDQLFTDAYEKDSEARAYYEPYMNAADDVISQIEYSFVNDGEGIFPVYTNARQICAVRVLESFYRFKLMQLYEKNQEDIGEIYEKMWEDVHKTEEEYYRRRKELEEKADEYSDKALGEIFVTPFIENPSSDLGLGDIKKSIQIRIDAEAINVEGQNAVLLKLKSYSNDVVNICQVYYNEQKQLLEEYWLRCGGLLKYIRDPDVYMCLSGERENLIFDFLVNPLYPVSSMGKTLSAYKELLDIAKHDYEFFKSLYKDYLDNTLPESKEEEEESTGPENPDFTPDIEREAITEFQEASDMGSWGAELSEPIFGAVGVSASFDGETIELEFNSILGGRKFSYNFSDGSSYSHKIIGATAMGDTKWFTDRATISKVLDGAGSVGKAAKGLGKIGFSYSDGTQSGSYIERNSANRISDVGTIYVRETGGGIGKLGKSEKIEIKKSLINGVSIKNKTTKYKFWFGTFEH